MDFASLVREFTANPLPTVCAVLTLAVVAQAVERRRAQTREMAMLERVMVLCTKLLPLVEKAQKKASHDES